MYSTIHTLTFILIINSSPLVVITRSVIAFFSNIASTPSNSADISNGCIFWTSAMEPSAVSTSTNITLPINSNPANTFQISLTYSARHPISSKDSLTVSNCSLSVESDIHEVVYYHNIITIYNKLYRSIIVPVETTL